MTRALTEITSQSLSMWEDKSKLVEIKKLCAPKLSDMEFQYLISLGRATGLDPFKREIWAVKYGDSPAQVFIGRDGYRKAAHAHKDYDFHYSQAVYENDKFEIIDGNPKHSFALKDRGQLIGAFAIAKRRHASQAVVVFVELKEYSTGKSLWHPQTGKPATMIKKVAEAQCLRTCFPDLLNGAYAAEENWRDDQEPKTMRTIEGETQTERLNNILKQQSPVIDINTGEILNNSEDNCESPKTTYNTGSDEVLATDLQIDQILALVLEKDIEQERIQRFLERCNVSELKLLSDAQARLLILKLGEA